MLTWCLFWYKENRGKENRRPFGRESRQTCWFDASFCRNQYIRRKKETRRHFQRECCQKSSFDASFAWKTINVICQPKGVAGNRQTSYIFSFCLEAFFSSISRVLSVFRKHFCHIFPGRQVVIPHRSSRWSVSRHHGGPNVEWLAWWCPGRSVEKMGCHVS